jgi:hypothetical protein
MLPATARGTSARGIRGRGHRDPREALLRAAEDELAPERLALVPLEVLGVADHEDAVARGDPEDGQEGDQRAQRQDAVAERFVQRGCKRSPGEARGGARPDCLR